MTWDPQQAQRILDELKHQGGALLPILHAVQSCFGYVPPEAVAAIADTLNLSRAEVHGVISFYHDFRSEPPPRLVVKLCRAEACQAMGGREAAAALLARLGLDWSTPSADGAVAVEPVYCLGLCAAAPAALLGQTPVVRFDGASLGARVEAEL